jgi:hypothetical protein
MSWYGIRHSLRLLSETFSKWSDANDFAPTPDWLKMKNPNTPGGDAGGGGGLGQMVLTAESR